MFVFYSTPEDVIGTTALYSYDGQFIRYQINLTDHAFWLGSQCFDKCIEFRSYGASISKEYREIQSSKITVTQNDLFLPESVSEIGELETAVFIKTEIPKANIYLNQIYQGKTPIEIKGIIPGYYTLSVEFTQFSEQTVVKTYMIEIKSSEYQNYYIPHTN